jgi:hypothetical protein
MSCRKGAPKEDSDTGNFKIIAKSSDKRWGQGTTEYSGEVI